MHRYVHLTVAVGSAAQDPKKLETTISFMCPDWMRYASNAWVLWTDRSLQNITVMLKPLLEEADQILALSINPHDIPAGYMPQWAWDWFNRYRDPHTGAVNWPPPVLPPLLSPPPLPPAPGLDPNSPLGRLLTSLDLPKK
jgi:hypothetical protein